MCLLVPCRPSRYGSAATAGKVPSTGRRRRQALCLAFAGAARAGRAGRLYLERAGDGLTAAGTSRTGLSGIHKIRHVIIIMQENRSFDSYFGTYPGA